MNEQYVLPFHLERKHIRPPFEWIAEFNLWHPKGSRKQIPLEEDLDSLRRDFGSQLLPCEKLLFSFLEIKII